MPYDPLNRPYKVWHIPAAEATTSVLRRDISPYVHAIDKFTDSDQDEISSAHLVINTIDGAFITDKTLENNAVRTPIIDQYDEIEVELTDDDGTAFTRIMIVDERLPDEDEKAGHLVTYTLYAREYYMKLCKITGHYWFRTNKDMINIIKDHYNASKGPSQPSLEVVFDGVPDYPVSTWRWSDGTNTFDALVRVVERLSNPVSASGAGTYHTIKFGEKENDRTTIVATISEMGSDTTHTLFNQPVPNTSPAERTHLPPGHVIHGSHRDTQYMARTNQPAAANIVVAKGMQDMGRMPHELADYSSAIELYNTYPLWSSAVTYDAGVRVRSDRFVSNPTAVDGTAPACAADAEYEPDGKVYECIADGTAGGTLSDTSKWRRLYYRDIIGSIDHTPLTSRQQAIRGACGNARTQVFNKSIFEREQDHMTDPTVPTLIRQWLELRGVRPRPASLAIPDSNLVVKDGRDYRNWVNVRVSDPSEIPARLLYPNDPDRTSQTERNADFARRIPEDFRVLIVPASGHRRSLNVSEDAVEINTDYNTFYSSVTRNGAGASTGTGAANSDDFGLSYDNALAQWRDGKWTVIRRACQWNECAVLDEGVVYQYSGKTPVQNPRRRAAGPTLPFAWRPMFTGTITSDPIAGNDCFHYPTTLATVDGLTYQVDKDGSGGKYTDGSAVLTEYTFGGAAGSDITFRPDPIASAFTALWDLFNYNMYSVGWWGILFSAPSPMQVYPISGQLTPKVGELFGGFEWWNDDVKPQGVLDLNNMTYTPSGRRGWQAPDSKNLGVLAGISFYFKFDIRFAGLLNDTRLWAGDIPFRVTMYDTEDNVWIADFNVRFLNETQHVMIPFTNFRIYRARNPIALNVDDTYTNIITPELHVLEIFEQRRVKLITLQWQEAYDKDGRFDPFGIQKFLLRFLSDLTSSAIVATGTVDSFAFVKAPYAVATHAAGTAGTGSRHLMGNIEENGGISNTLQLQRTAEAKLDIAQFRRDNMTVRVTGRCDIRPGDYVWVRSEDLISEADMPYTNLTTPPAESTGGTADAYAASGTSPPDGVEVRNGKWYWKNTKRLAVRRVNHTVSAMGGPAGFVTHITLRDRIGWENIGLI